MMLDQINDFERILLEFGYLADLLIGIVDGEIFISFHIGGKVRRKVHVVGLKQWDVQITDMVGEVIGIGIDFLLIPKVNNQGDMVFI